MRWNDREFLDLRRQLFRKAPIPHFDLGISVDALRKSQQTRPTVGQVLAQANRLLIQPRSGVSDHEEMKRLLRTLGHADIGTVTIDSYTRLNLWDKAQSEVGLNGYPLVTRGMERGRELAIAAPKPVEVRHGSPNGCVLAEVAYASGITSFEGGGISYNLPYCKDVPLADSIRNWQYADRLTGWLSAASGVVLDRETFGTLTAVLMPPSISIAISVLELLLAVEQGVRCVTIGFPESGCLVQDVAALHLIPLLCGRHVRQILGETPVEVYTALHQWMGVFPPQRRQAIDLIGFGVLAGVVGNATKLINKTYEEAVGIPSPKANARSIRYCQELVQFCTDRQWLKANLWLAIQNMVAEEQEQILWEVEDILAAVYELNHGDLASAVVVAFERGILDIPFPASRHARGRVLPARDAAGAIRYQSYGGLAVRAEAARRNRERLGNKAQFRYQDILNDVYFMAKGQSLHTDKLRRAVLDEFYEVGYSSPGEPLENLLAANA